MAPEHLRHRPLTAAVVGALIIGLLTACTATPSATITEEGQAALSSALEADTETSQLGSSEEASDEGQAADPGADASATSTPRRLDESGCTYLGTDDFGDMQVELEFIYDADDLAEVEVVYSLYTANDLALSLIDTLPLVQPGEYLRIQMDTLEREPEGVDPIVSCSLDEVEPLAPFGPTFLPAVGDQCIVVGADGVGDIQVELDFANPVDGPAEVLVTYALRGPDGARFASQTTLPIELGPNERATSPSDSFATVPLRLDDSPISCDIVGFEQF